MTRQNQAETSHNEQDVRRKQGNGACVGTQKFRAGDVAQTDRAEQGDEPTKMAG